MRSTPLVLGLTVSVGLLASARGAFEPLFRVAEISGNVTLRAPGASAYAAAEEGKAYLYGTRLKAPAEAGARLLFSDRDDGRFEGAADFDLREDPLDPAHKVIGLAAGKLTLSLSEPYRQANRLSVETACTSIEALTGGRCTLDARTEGELDVVLVCSEQGQLRLTGPEYEIPLLGSEACVSVACARDGSFTRIKNVKGQFSVVVRGADGTARSIDTQPGTEIKIWRRASESGDAVIVTILVASNGTVQETITYVIPVEPVDTDELIADQDLMTADPAAPTATPTSPSPMGEPVSLPPAPIPTPVPLRPDSPTTTPVGGR